MKRFRLGLLAAAMLFATGCSSNVKDGISYLEEENYEEAIVCFQENVDNDANLAEAYRGLGIANFELENYQEAADAFENALKNDAKESAAIYSFLGTSYLKLEDNEKALENYHAALEQQDCSEELKQEILYNEIGVYENMGEWDTVEEKVKAYMDAYPEDKSLEKTVEFLETR